MCIKKGNVRRRQDSNLQSSDSKSDALSIRPLHLLIWNVSVFSVMDGLYDDDDEIFV